MCGQVIHGADSSYGGKSHRERQRELAKLTFAVPILQSAPLPGSPEKIERVVRDAGVEGIVAKRLDSIYEPGIQGRNSLKVRFNKRQEGCSCPATRLLPATPPRDGKRPASHEVEPMLRPA